MKKQLLAAAVAATMTSVAMADISITGDAKFEYKNVEISEGNSTNKTNTEANLSIKGKNGDTAVVANVELNSHSNTTVSTADAVHVEDLYVTTKIGDISVKAGNYATGTSAILGEIDNGGRATNKVTLSTTFNGVKVYAGNSGNVAGASDTMLDGNMFAGIVADVAGYKVQAKKNSATVNSYGIAGDVAGFGIRLEQKANDTANSDVTFGQVTKDVNGIKLGYAWVDADAANLITEDDSAIFAVEAAGADGVDGLKQISAQMGVAGNTVTLKSGTVEEGSTDNDFTQIDVKRALASGATLAVTYTDKDDFASDGSADTSTTETLEIDLSVKF